MAYVRDVEFSKGEEHMPVVHKSTIKAARQAEKRRERNRAVMSNVKGMIKKVSAAVKSKEPNSAKTSLKEATSTIEQSAG